METADPSGALRLIILIATFTGRRFESILRLLVEDVVYDNKRMREVLDEADEEVRVEWAAHFKNGILNFRREWDKENYHWPVPLSVVLRSQIDDYLEARGLESGPLFFSERNPKKPLAQSTISKSPWDDPKTGRTKIGRFDRAWRLAREYLIGAGQDPDDLMPIRAGYKLLRIRGFNATHMEKLLYGKANLGADEAHSFDDHANYIGGWALNNGVKSKHYVPLDPEILMGVVEWKKATDVRGDRANLESERAARAKERLADALLRGRAKASPKEAS